MTKKVAIIIDNPFRDLQNCCLLALALLEKKWKVYFVFLENINKELFNIRPHVVVLTHHRINVNNLIVALKKCNIKSVVLDTEGGVFISYDHLHQVITSNHKSNKLLEKYLCWGLGLEGFLKENKFYESSKIKITGTPKVDFYHPSFHSFAFELFNKNYGKKYNLTSGEFFLVNMNFPLVNNLYRDKRHMKETYLKLKRYSKQYVDEWFFDTDIRLEIMINIVRELASHFSNQLFVVRPHPFEKKELYCQEFKDLKNVKIIKDGQVDSWIVNSLAVIQKSCSSGLEALVANKPNLSPGWFNSKFHFEYVEQLSHQTKDIQDLINVTQNIIDGNYSYPESIKNFKEEIISKTYHKIDGNSYKRVANEIDNISIGSINYWSYYFYYFNHLWLKEYNLKKIIYSFYMKNKKLKSREKKNIEPKDIHEFLNDLQRYLNINVKIKIKRKKFWSEITLI